MEMLKINNREIIMTYRIVMIITSILFITLSLFAPYSGFLEYRGIFIIISISLTIITIVKIMYGKYIDIRVFPEYLIVKEFYLLQSIQDQPIKTFRAPYTDLIDFYRDEKKDMLFFYVNIKDDYNTTFFFSSKYISAKEKKGLECFLQQKIINNEKDETP